MKHALFYLDPNITTHTNNPLYTPSIYAQLITTRNYVNDECTYVHSLPKGDHVLTIKTKPEVSAGAVYFSHLI